MTDSIKLIHMHASPWSERVRWGLRFKNIAYEQQTYQPGLDEEEIFRISGQKQVPVLIAQGTAIPDSTRILDWLEEQYPDPALCPISAQERAEVVLWEELMENAFGPQARLLIIGRMMRSGIQELQQASEFFGRKYGHTPYAENLAAWNVKRIMGAINTVVEERNYLVGGSFSRADITVASMLGMAKPAPNELFEFSEPLRSMFTEPAASSSDSSFATLFKWRDKIYEAHRGEIVIQEEA